MSKIRDSFCSFLRQNGFKYICQSEISYIYSDLFFNICGKINTLSLNKIFKINFASTPNNLLKFIYPVLMLVDIIIFDPCTVVVGHDQIHNIRFVKNLICKKLNIDLNIDFNVLDIKITNPINNKKMSTSEENRNITLDSTLEEIINIIKLTPSGSVFPLHYNACNANIKNLINIVAIIDNMDINEAFIRDRSIYNKFLPFKLYVANKIYKYLQEYKTRLCEQSRINFDDVKEIVNKNYNRLLNC